MSAQTEYGYLSSKGAPGTLYDNAPHEVISRRNEEAAGKLRYGLGVVIGTNKGYQVKLPITGASMTNFEGVVIDGYTDEMDLDGNVSIKYDGTVGVVRKGNIWARLAKDATPGYGDDVYLVTSGDEAGYFTNVAGANTLKITGARFLRGKGTGIAAPISLG